MQIKEVDLEKTELFSIGRQYSKNVLAIHFVNLPNLNNKYIYYKIDDIEEEIPLVSDLFIVSRPLTMHSGKVKAQIIVRDESNETIDLTKNFTMIIEASNYSGIGEDENYPDDPNIKNYFVKIDEKVNSFEELANLVQTKLDNGDFVGAKGPKGEKGDPGEKGEPGDVTEEYRNLASQIAQNASDAQTNATNAQTSATNAQKVLDDTKDFANQAKSEMNQIKTDTNTLKDEANNSAINAKASEDKAKEYADNLQASTDDISKLKEDLSRLSEEKVENPLTGVVGQILEIETVDESGKPKTYKAVNKPSGGGEVTDEQISNAVDNYMTAHPFTETDPTVPDWAKQSQKPTYTASEVGALPIGTKIPSKTSDLQNDSGFLTEHQDLSGYATKGEIPKTASDVGADASGTAESKVSVHNTATDSHNDIRELISGLTQRLNALADSDDTTLDQMSEVVAYIKSNKNLIDAITNSKVSVSDIINNLTTNLSNKPLSAAMGVELKKLIDAIKVPVNLSELAGDTTHRTVTDAEKTTWNNKSTFSGSYNDLTNKPSLFSGNYNDLSGKPTLITEERVNELINAKLPKSAEEVQY